MIVFPRLLRVLFCLQKTELLHCELVAVFEKAYRFGDAGGGRQIGEKAVNRADQRQKLVRFCLCYVFKVIQSARLIEGKLSDPGAQQGLHCGARAESISEIFAERTDIGAL